MVDQPVFVLNINNKENFKYGLYENVEASLYVYIYIYIYIYIYNVHQKYLQIKQELFTSMHTYFVEMERVMMQIMQMILSE